MENKKVYIGIDPGSAGAIVLIDSDRNVLEMMSTPKNGKEYDLQSICIFLNKLKNMKNVHAALEDVHAFQGSGATSNFNFGRGKMLWEMGLMAFKIPHTLVQPRKWQNVAWEGVTKTMVSTSRKKKNGESVKKVDTKATSLTAVQRLYPDVDLRDPNRKTDRSKKPHDGVIDALLIAEYARRSF